MYVTETELTCYKRLIYVIIDSLVFSANCGSNPYVWTAWTGGNDLDVEVDLIIRTHC